MLKGILSITGKPGLFRLLSRGRNALIVENIATKRRTPTYPHEKVISLADITMYTEHGDEPLSEILEKVKTHAGCQPIDMKGFAGDEAVRDYFAEIIPDFERDRVYTTDIRKLFSWYNQLIAAGITEFKDDEVAEDQTAEKTDSAQSAE